VVAYGGSTGRTDPDPPGSRRTPSRRKGGGSGSRQVISRSSQSSHGRQRGPRAIPTEAGADGGPARREASGPSAVSLGPCGSAGRRPRSPQREALTRGPRPARRGGGAVPLDDLRLWRGRPASKASRRRWSSTSAGRSRA